MKRLVPESRRGRGFTLIELIMAMVIVTVGAALTLQGFITPAQSIAADAEVQTSTQVAQACAEHILALRGVQTNGWNYIQTGASGATLCNNLPLPAGYTRTLSVVALADTTSPCIGAFTPNGNSCKEVTITAGKTSGTIPAASYRFTVVNY